MALVVKNPPANARDAGFDPWIRKIPWRRKWQPTQEFLLGKSHGQRSLVGYSPWSRKRVRHDLVTEYAHMCLLPKYAVRVYLPLLQGVCF